MNFATRNTRGFNQDVTGFRHRLPGQMINDISLIFVWREANDFSPLSCQGQQCDDGFVYLRTIVNATSAQYDTNLFHHDDPSLQLAEAHN
jgi:hypothetical protein